MGKKTKTAKLPKEVMGVKLPKEVREIGGALLEKAQSPQGREMLAAGLTMAAAAASAAVAKGRAKREAAAAAPQNAAHPAPPATPGAPTPAEPPTPPTPPQGTQMQPDPQAIAEAVGKAAEAMLGRLFGKREG